MPLKTSHAPNSHRLKGLFLFEVHRKQGCEYNTRHTLKLGVLLHSPELCSLSHRYMGLTLLWERKNIVQDHTIIIFPKIIDDF